LNNTSPTTTGVNTGAPNSTQKTQYWTTPTPLQLGWTQVLCSCFCSTSEPFVLLIFYYKNNQSVSFWRTFLE
jgi:hypothetical protein